MTKSLFLALVAAVLLLPAAARAEGRSFSPAAQFVQKLGDTALMSLTKKNMPRGVREGRVREILRANFDINAIGKTALGTYWREASGAQQQEYLRLFENMIVDTYTTRFEDYAGQTLKVGSTAAAGKDFIVASQVLQKDGPPVNLEWRVASRDGGLRVTDVVVEGVSMSITQRSEFASVIQQGGGKVSALIESLRQRASAKTAAKSAEG